MSNTELDVGETGAVYEPYDPATDEAPAGSESDCAGEDDVDDEEAAR